MPQPLAIEVLTHTTARGLHRLVEVGMASYGSEENPEVFPSIEALAERVGMGQSSVRDHIAELLTVGEIERVGKRGRATIYRITCRWRSMPDYSTLPAAVSRRRVTSESAVSRRREVAAQRRFPASRSTAQRRIPASRDTKSTPQYATESAVLRNRKPPYRGAAIKTLQVDPSGSLTPPAPPYTEMSESTTSAGMNRPHGLVEPKLDQSVNGLSATEPGAIDGVTANGVPAAEEERRLALAESARAAFAELIDTGKLRPTLAALGWDQARDGQVSEWLQTLPLAKLTTALKVARAAQRQPSAAEGTTQ
jgi:hypothetical protein